MKFLFTTIVTVAIGLSAFAGANPVQQSDWTTNTAANLPRASIVLTNGASPIKSGSGPSSPGAIYLWDTNNIGFDQIQPDTNGRLNANSGWSGSFYGNGGGLTNVPARNYVGLLAPNGRVPGQFISGNKYFQTRLACIYPYAITNIGIVVANWYGNSATPSGGNAFIKASVEYPSNTFSQITWGGLAYTNVASGSNAASDLVAFNIPANAQYWIRLYYTNSAGIVYSQYSPYGTTSEFGPSGISDKTLGGTVGSVQGNVYLPSIIIGNTTHPSVLVASDSRDFGLNGTQLAFPYCGIDALLGPLGGEGNISIPGDRFSNYLNNPVRYNFATNYATVLWTDLGINEIANSAGATLYSSATNFYAQFAYLPIYQETLLPYTVGSADGYTSVSGQTNNTGDSYRTNFNEMCRSNSMPYLTGYLDVDALVESSRDSGTWYVMPTTNITGSLAITSDGLHSGINNLPSSSYFPWLRQAFPNPFVNPVPVPGGWPVPGLTWTNNAAGQIFAGALYGTFNGSAIGNGSGLTNLTAAPASIIQSWPVGVTNSTVETTVFSTTVNGGVFGTNGAFEVYLEGEGAGITNCTFHIYLGGTVINASTFVGSAFASYNLQRFFGVNNGTNIFSAAQGSGTSFGTSGAALTRAYFNTATNFVLSLTMQNTGLTQTNNVNLVRVRLN